MTDQVPLSGQWASPLSRTGAPLRAASGRWPRTAVAVRAGRGRTGCHSSTRLPSTIHDPAESTDTLRVLDVLGHVRSLGAQLREHRIQFAHPEVEDGLRGARPEVVGPGDPDVANTGCPTPQAVLVSVQAQTGAVPGVRPPGATRFDPDQSRGNSYRPKAATTQRLPGRVVAAHVLRPPVSPAPAPAPPPSGGAAVCAGVPPARTPP